MAIVTPVIVNQSMFSWSDNNAYQMKGFAGISTGALLLAMAVPNRSSNWYKSTEEAAEPWLGLGSPNLGSPSFYLGDDQQGWTTTPTEGSVTTVSPWSQSQEQMGYKYPTVGNEDDTRDLWGQYGSTSFGNNPRFYAMFEITGVDPSVPVRCPSTYCEFRVSVPSSLSTLGAGFTLPSAAPGTVSPNSLELTFASSYTGTSASSFTTGTELYNISNSTDSGARAVCTMRTTPADGSLEAITFSTTRYSHGRRVIIQGVEPPDPVFFEAPMTAEAAADASMRNVSQERRNAEQAIDRRQHIWVSDLNGVRKVSLR